MIGWHKLTEEQKNAYKGRTWMILAYPDNLEHWKAYTKICKSCNCAWILHDKDINDDGEPKKEHWHIMVQFRNARQRGALSRDFGIEKRFFEPFTLKDGLLYLIHNDDFSKYQYDVSEVQGNLKNRLEAYLASDLMTESEFMERVIKYMKTESSCKCVTDILMYCISIGQYSRFRINYRIIKDTWFTIHPATWGHYTE